VIEVLKLGIQFAFFKGIDVLMTGFQKAVTFLSTAMKEIMENISKSTDFSIIALTFKTLFDGIGDLLSSKLLNAISNIPGLGNLEKAAKQSQRGADLNLDIASHLFKALDFGKAASDLDVGGVIKKATEEANKIGFGESDSGKEADRLFNKLKPLIEAAKKTGDDLVKNAQTDNNNAAPEGVLTDFSGSSSRVIADSLAKIGGGGNYLRVGMSLQEQKELKALLAAEQTAQSTSALVVLEKNKKPAIPVIGQ
jgi:hypothetical protein